MLTPPATQNPPFRRPFSPADHLQSADLTGSNLTRWKDAQDFQPESTKLGSYAGRYVRYGVREHGMAAIMNGLAAYGKGLVIPAGGTFLNFVSCESASTEAPVSTPCSSA